jgi:anti-sigma factor RsiW
MREGWHPGDHELRLFELGKLSDDESRQIERHLASCPSCRERIVETEATDAFIQWLRKFHQEKPTTRDAGP